MCLCLKKKISFPEMTRHFKYEWLLLFPGFVILPVKMHLTASVLFGRDFPTKTSRIKSIFSQSFRPWPSAVSYFTAHYEGKKSEN